MKLLISLFLLLQHKKKCVIEEYNTFCPLNASYSPHCVNGEQTQGENIADNGGIHAAYRAYRNIIDFYGPDPALPGHLASKFTHDQLFFLSFAQIWCDIPLSPDLILKQLIYDDHSPSRYRVQGTIQNFPAFRSAFNCPIGSNSAPKDHCNVWISDVDITKTPQSSDVLNIPEKHLIKPDDKFYTKYKQIQAFFQASMNLSVDPCNNFYEYACSAIKDDILSEMNDKSFKIMVKMMDSMLEGDYQGDMIHSTAINKTLQFYSACKNTASAIKSKTLSAVLDGSIANGVLGEFEQATGYKFNWCDMKAENTNSDPTILSKALAFLSFRFGVDTLVTTEIDVNPKRDQRFTSNYSFSFDQNTVTFEKPYYQAAETWKKFTYHALKRNMLKVFKDYTKSIKMNCEIGVLEYHVENILKFEYLLATNFSANEDLRTNASRNVNPVTIGNIPYEFFDWKYFITGISKISGANFVDNSDVDDYWVMMAEPEAMKKLNDYLPKVGMDTVVKYLYYRLLLSQKDYIDTDSNEEYIQLYPSKAEPRRRGRKSRAFKDPFISKFSDVKASESITCAEKSIEWFGMPNGRILTEGLYPTEEARASFKKGVTFF